jgi:hypothetical protein
MAKEQGLRLTVGGAPNTPHIVPGLPGFYYPDKPTPVGGDGEASVEQAEKAAEGSTVEIVHITPKEAGDAREALTEVQEAARKGILERRKDAQGNEADVLKDHVVAVGGGKAGR